MGRASRWQRKRRDTKQENEQKGKALLPELIEKAADRVVAFPLEPALDLVAQLLRGTSWPT
jgi:hypothetical protein